MPTYRITFTSRHRETPTSEITEINLSFDVTAPSRDEAYLAGVARLTEFLVPDAVAHFTGPNARWHLSRTPQAGKAH